MHRLITASLLLRPTTPNRSGHRSSWPILVFFNGLGGHRLIAAMIEGIALAHRVQILTLDKPSGSVHGIAIPCTHWMHATLLAILVHLHIARFAVLSHSNGLFYALYVLLWISFLPSFAVLIPSLFFF
ncbi:hypothetical protein FB451DRAFT_1416520 [Mycena latifolia]|nr:hypothetical protein FB451DRAFT_1416520 [Mycena latifolia]